MPECAGCERLPLLANLAGELYLAAALAHSSGSVRAELEGGGFRYRVEPGGVLAVRLDAGDLPRLAQLLARRLSLPEQEACRVVFVPAGETYAPRHLAQTRTLATLAAQAEGAWLSEMLAADRLESHFQPIVPVARPSEVFAYECLLRGRTEQGALVFPDRLFPTARAAGMLFHLDRAARICSIRQAGRYGIGQRLFINFNPTAIYDPRFCLRTTLAAVQELGLEPGRIVFEVIESENIDDVEHLLGILEYYRRHGFGVALDDLGAGYGSLNLLQRLRPDYVKFDRELVSGVDHNTYKAKIFRRLAQMAADLGVPVIAEGVETQAEWEWVAQHGVTYAQGYYLARPAAPPPVLEKAPASV